MRKVIILLIALGFINVSEATIQVVGGELRISSNPDATPGTYVMEEGENFISVFNSSTTPHGPCQFIMNGGVVQAIVTIWSGAYGEMNGGWVGGPYVDPKVRVENSGSKFVLNNGSVGALQSNENASIDVYGGEVRSHIQVSNEGSLNLFGGNIRGEMCCFGGNVTLYGDLYVNGTHVTDDRSILQLSNIGYDPHGGEKSLTGNITGTLREGGTIDVTYYVKNFGDIAVFYAPVPEPATVLLLSLGGLLIRKR